MPAEAVLLSVYAVVLLGVAHGLRVLGHRSTSPWASRTLTGHLRVNHEEPVSPDDWPHCEVPRLYTGMALTAALASVALSIAGLALHHEAVAGALLGAVVVMAGGSVLHIGAALRR